MDSFILENDKCLTVTMTKLYVYIVFKGFWRVVNMMLVVEKETASHDFFSSIS